MSNGIAPYNKHLDCLAPQSKGGKVFRKAITGIQKEVYEFYITGNYTQNDLAIKFEVSQPVIHRLLRKEKLKRDE